MSQILGVKFNDYGQVYYFMSGPFVVREGQHVLVKTDQGLGMGKVVLTKQAPLDDDPHEEELHKPIYRLANEEDLASAKENATLAQDAFQYCRRCISTHKLGMKLVDVEVFFDRSKMIFYFTAPGRIDFRELIKDLVREYRTRIELRQIGVRHETQMLGAIGNCGQICCCRRFMRKFVPVTIKMAKEQNLFLNPKKISGICGRLLCCLSFEQEGYEEFHRMCPRIGKKFTTAIGPVKVLRSNFFKKSVTLLTEGFEEKEVSIDEWNEMINKPPSAATQGGAKKSSGQGKRRSRKNSQPSASKKTSHSQKSTTCEESVQNEGKKSKQPFNGKPRGAKGRQDQPRSSRPDQERERSLKSVAPQERSQSQSSGDDAHAEDHNKRSRRPRRRRRRPRK